MSDGLLDMDEAAAYLKISKKALYAKTAARSVPFTKVGRYNRFSQAHLDEIVRAGEQPVIEAPTQIRGGRRAGRSGRAA